MSDLDRDRARAELNEAMGDTLKLMFSQLMIACEGTSSQAQQGRERFAAGLRFRQKAFDTASELIDSFPSE